MAANHTIHGGDHRHLAWDNSTTPAMTVAPGDIVQFDDLDATSGQLTADSTVADIDTLDFALINPIAGPVYIDGAEPGDAPQGHPCSSSCPIPGPGPPSCRASACSPTTSPRRRCICGPMKAVSMCRPCTATTPGCP